MYVSHDWLMYA